MLNPVNRRRNRVTEFHSIHSNRQKVTFTELSHRIHHMTRSRVDDEPEDTEPTEEPTEDPGPIFKRDSPPPNLEKYNHDEYPDLRSIRT